MFGFGDKTRDVRLTEKELESLKDGMSRAERKDFDRRQRQAEKDRMWEAWELEELFEDDD